jgi:hypothetical protein
MNTSVAPSQFDNFELAEKADRSIRRAVRKLYEERARANETVSIWRDGKVVVVPARDLLDEQDRKVLAWERRLT